MSASAATTARPRAAAIAWAHADAIFVEIPHKDGGPPFIVRYPKTLDGLARALNIIVENPESAPRPHTPPSHPAIKAKKDRVPWATDEQRAAAQAVLKKLKIT